MDIKDTRHNRAAAQRGIEHPSSAAKHTPTQVPTARTIIQAPPAQQPRSHIGFKIVASFLLLVIATSVLGMGVVQYKQHRIQEEIHIESLYGTYRSNLTSCTEEAKKAEKDNAFIKKNCNDVINDSIIGKWLSKRRSDLIEK